MRGYHTRIPREEKQTINVECPFCKGKMHLYNLLIKRTTILFSDYGFADFEQIYHPLKEQPHYRIFTCPIKQKEFKAMILLLESKENIVDDIEITCP